MSNIHSRKKPAQVRIIQMGEQFLYLPVYYAIHKNLFGFLGDRDKDYTFLPVHERYINKGTDQAVFDFLDDTRKNTENTIYIAMGDPRSVGAKRNWSSSTVRLVGALITGTPFWAIDHGLNNTNTIEDLCSFNEIVSYKEGTTSYDLVRSILNDYDTDRKVNLVEKPGGTEIDLAIRDPKSGQIIISPDIITIVNAMEREKAINIELSLGSDHQLCDLLITALATTQQTIEEDKYFVKAFIQAIQRSICELHIRSSEIMQFAAERYHNMDIKLIEEALRYAEDSKVYPNNIAVTEALWIRALTGAIRANGIPANNETLTHAKNVYKIIGSNAQKLHKEAIADALISPRSDTEQPKLPFMPRVDGIGLIYFFMGSLASVAIFRDSHQNMLFTLVFIFLWYLFIELYFNRRISIGLTPRAIAWCGGVVIPAIWIYNFLSPASSAITIKDIILALFVIPIGFILTFIYERYKRNHIPLKFLDSPKKRNSQQ